VIDELPPMNPLLPAGELQGIARQVSEVRRYPAGRNCAGFHVLTGIRPSPDP